MTERIWTNRSPGDVACREVDGPNGKPVRDGTLLLAGFIASTVFVVPEGTPAEAGGSRPHPFAGRVVTVTRRFYGPDPFTNSGRVAHLWAAEAGLGVAETSRGFVCYLLDDRCEEIVDEDVTNPGAVEIHGLDDEALLGDDEIIERTSAMLRGRIEE